MSLPRDAQIEIEYNPHQPSIGTIVCQVEALGYWVIARRLPAGHPWWKVTNYSFTYQRVGSYILHIYPPPFDPQWNEDVIAGEQFWQVNCDSVEVEVTKDLSDINRSAPYIVFEDPASEIYGLAAIQYQGEIIFWLQREYGEHMRVEYTLYEDFLVRSRQGRHIYPKYIIARLSNLRLLN